MDNMEHARKYFAQAMKLNSNNMRALFGFYLVSASLLSSNLSTSISLNLSLFLELIEPKVPLLAHGC